MSINPSLVDAVFFHRHIELPDSQKPAIDLCLNRRDKHRLRFVHIFHRYVS